MKHPVNNGINYQPQLVSRISAINSIAVFFFSVIVGKNGGRWERKGLGRESCFLVDDLDILEGKMVF